MKVGQLVNEKNQRELLISADGFPRKAVVVQIDPLVLMSSDMTVVYYGISEERLVVACELDRDNAAEFADCYKTGGFTYVGRDGIVKDKAKDQADEIAIEQTIKVGDVVAEMKKGTWGAFKDHRYTRAVVAQINPIVLISRTGLQVWTNITASDVVITDEVANEEEMIVVMRRYYQMFPEKKPDSPFYKVISANNRRGNNKQIAKGIYKHFKGPLYMVLHSSIDCETQEEIVNYVAIYGINFRLNSQPRRRFEEMINCYRRADGSIVSERSLEDKELPKTEKLVLPRFMPVIINKDALINLTTQEL